MNERNSINNTFEYSKFIRELIQKYENLKFEIIEKIDNLKKQSIIYIEHM